MKVSQVTKIIPSMLVSSNLPEDTLPEWNSTTTYALDFIVQIGSEHKTWKSLSDDNLAFDPRDPTNVLKWYYNGPTNRWGMFDEDPNTLSTNTGSITVVLRPGRINTLGLINISADTAYLKMQSDTDGVVKEQTYDLTEDILSSDWYSYFFDPVKRKTDVVIDNLPTHGDCTITLTLTAATQVSIGVSAFGMDSYIGRLLFGAKAGGIDSSRNEYDDQGNLILLRRKNAARLEGTLAVEPNDADGIKNLMDEVRSQLLVWNGNGDDNVYQSLIIYGFRKEYEMSLAEPTQAYLELEINGAGIETRV